MNVLEGDVWSFTLHRASAEWNSMDSTEAKLKAANVRDSPTWTRWGDVMSKRILMCDVCDAASLNCTV